MGSSGNEHKNETKLKVHWNAIFLQSWKFYFCYSKWNVQYLYLMNLLRLEFHQISDDSWHDERSKDTHHRHIFVFVLAYWSIDIWWLTEFILISFPNPATENYASRLRYVNRMTWLLRALGFFLKRFILARADHENGCQSMN